eukprot:SAG31_NODE_417_length_15907_cov_6.901759_3_plen_107_part_00
MQTLQAVTVSVGEKAGFGKAELRGMIVNLQTVFVAPTSYTSAMEPIIHACVAQQIGSIIAPLLWSNVYACGVRRNRDGAFYWLVSAITVVQLILSRGLPIDIDDAA